MTPLDYAEIISWAILLIISFRGLFKFIVKAIDEEAKRYGNPRCGNQRWF